MSVNSDSAASQLTKLLEELNEDSLSKMSDADVLELLKCALTTGIFKGSEWCVAKPGGSWAACDSYQVIRSEWVENAHKNMQFEYYVKFAIGKSGDLILIVSCHLSDR